MKSAQSDMQQGRYTHAAESFALASVYNPRDARPQIARSHALLAAGEYLGSAVCLAKAIELDPRSTLTKSDLIEAVGGPDQFIQRITDLEQCAKTGSAPGLQLLLAYIYHQMDRPEEARTAVRAAKQGLPSSMSVDLLQAAIEEVAPG
jgi:Flp pilus assembly protein TadD